MIGQDVEIVIVDVRNGKVRLGINAPKHIPVHRKEVYEAIHKEKCVAE
jgi:carbon storage regulator